MSAPIGQINGKWAGLFKLSLAAMPFFAGWAIWTTGQIYEIKIRLGSSAPVTLETVILRDKDNAEELKRYLDGKLELYPPPYLIDQVKSNSINQQSIIERLNAVEHEQIRARKDKDAP